ncbi:MAG: hypothetical protein GF411_11710 [Candidatus Lokiarchaeota archaeon]|nr:hypothetical protein [Candidatus Lokiarchaeota archaeon]
MYSRYQIMVISICLALAAPGFVTAFATPIANPIVVTFQDTHAERAALDTFQGEISNAITVEYGSIQYNLMKMRSIGPMVFIGHGNDNGIEDKAGVVSAEQMQTEIQTTAAPQIFLLACDSDEIASMDKSGRTHGYNYMVDAELAAYDAVIRIKLFYGQIESAIDTFNTFREVLTSKFTGEREILWMGLSMLDPGDPTGGGTPEPVFSTREKLNAIRVFVLGCVFALIGFGIEVAKDKLIEAVTIECAGITMQSSKLVQVFNYVNDYGIGTLGQAVNGIYGGWGDMATDWLDTSVNCLKTWTDRMTAGEWAAFIAIIALEIVVVILTAGSEAWVRLVAGIGFAALEAATIAICDAHDSNYYPASTLMDAISGWDT